jgi:hypothetical protein
LHTCAGDSYSVIYSVAPPFGIHSHFFAKSRSHLGRKYVFAINLGVFQKLIFDCAA